MNNYDYDLVVIGAGSGGVRASRLAAGSGARVAVIEQRYLGGTCVNVGCIPKKIFVYGAHYAEDFQDARAYGWSSARPQFDWSTLRDNKTKEIQRLNTVYQQLLTDAGVTHYSGSAQLLDEHTVIVDEQRLTGNNILIATGSWPSIPDFPGKEYVISSNEVFHLQQFPGRVLIAGGGYIAAEFASIFAGLGAQTTMLYRKQVPLRGFDDDVRTFVSQAIVAQGVDLRVNSEIISVTATNDGLLAMLNTGDSISTDIVLYATGRKPLTSGLNLEQLGVATTANGAIIVNDSFQSSVPSIYALGDVIGGYQLTPVAINEAIVFVNALYYQQPKKLDYSLIPTAVFCQPNIACVGLTEQQARESYAHIDIYRSTFRPLKHTITNNEQKTLVKLIVDRESGRVLGVHMVGDGVGEIIQGVAIALKAGASKEVFDSTVAVHPTTAEELVLMRQAIS